ncbi:DNA-binding barrel domain superfamily [Sesbania bispinosa]|nr:DNA-binding barrel domain superfamily [Sesbania bispinosa]
MFSVSIHCNGDRAALIDVVEKVTRFYTLEEIHWVLFTYKGDRQFEIRLVNGRNVEVGYPKIVSESYVVNWKVESYEEDPYEPEFLWDVTLTKAAASGDNPMIIPVRFVRDVLNKKQEDVIVIDENGDQISYKLLKPKRRPTERYLSGRWYDFIRGKKLKAGDKLRFYSCDNVESVSICIDRN